MVALRLAVIPRHVGSINITISANPALAGRRNAPSLSSTIATMSRTLGQSLQRSGNIALLGMRPGRRQTPPTQKAEWLVQQPTVTEQRHEVGKGQKCECVSRNNSGAKANRLGSHIDDHACVWITH